jgi:hypothetical protein
MKNNAKKFPLPTGEQWARLPERVLALENTSSSGGRIEGSQYIFVAAKGTDVENAIELQAAYDLAKTMSPTANKRITVIAAPGYYNFGDVDFIMDTEYIDLVSLDGNRSIIFNSTPTITTNGNINVIANDVFVKGVDVSSRRFIIGNDLNLLKVENCIGGDFSFGGSFPTMGANNSIIEVSGTFINCEARDYSFSSNPMIYKGNPSGTFIDCKGRNLCFLGLASGTFTNCVVEDNSFGFFGTASGIFTNCIGGEGSFGSGINSTASGIFTNCIGGDGSFGSGDDSTASGTFTNCVAENNSFGAFATASGTFTNCVGGVSCFAGQGIASGTFNYCIASLESFGSGNLASGIFTNCIGGEGSFTAGGYGGDLTGKLYYCRTRGLFNTVSSGGRTYYCIDGNGHVNNQ